MQVINLLIFLMAIGIVIGPIAGVVVTNLDDPMQLVLPPFVEDVLIDNSGTSQGEGSGGFSGGIEQIVSPEMISYSVNGTERTFTLTARFENSYIFDLTLNSFSADIELNENHAIIGSLSLSNPVTIPAQQNALVTLQGEWTEQAELFIGEATSINVTLINLSANVNGIIIEVTEPYNIGNIPLS
jgi:hypothetical protein